MKYSFLWGLLFLVSCQSTAPVAQASVLSQGKLVQCGKASWYGARHHGKKAASGEKFSKNALTAAHPSLPLGTQVWVVNSKTGQKIEVKINDRGPFTKKRILDLSQNAFSHIASLKKGIVQVCVYKK